MAVLNTRLLALDEPAALRRKLGGTRVEIDVEGPADRWLEVLDRFSVGTLEARGSQIVATLADADSVPDLVAALVAHGARVGRVTPERRTLEDVYLALVGEREGAA